MSPIPTKIGFYRFLASKRPDLVGLSPAFHHGVEWQYTFDELYDKDCPKLVGQNALITGANSGVGYETAKALAKCGVHVTMACRNPKRCAKAADKIREEAKAKANDNEIITMTVDTSSLQSVQNFSREFLSMNQEKGRALDMLYFNAGILSANSPTDNNVNGRGSGSGSGSGSDDNTILSEDGIEMVFATNYLGHHLMYKLLKPLLLQSKLARIILVASSASFETFDYKVATSLETLNGEKRKDYWQTYGQTKLAQIMWAKYLTKLLDDEAKDEDNNSSSNNNIHVNACHPGAVDTYIWEKGHHSSELWPDALIKFNNYMRKNAMWTPEEGALTQLYLGVAVDQLVERDIRGRYFHPQAQEVVNTLSLDEKVQKDLWEFSDELVAKFL